MRGPPIYSAVHQTPRLDEDVVGQERIGDAAENTLRFVVVGIASINRGKPDRGVNECAQRFFADSVRTIRRLVLRTCSSQTASSSMECLSARRRSVSWKRQDQRSSRSRACVWGGQGPGLQDGGHTLQRRCRARQLWRELA